MGHMDIKELNLIMRRTIRLTGSIGPICSPVNNNNNNDTTIYKAP